MNIEEGCNEAVNHTCSKRLVFLCWNWLNSMMCKDMTDVFRTAQIASVEFRKSCTVVNQKSSYSYRYSKAINLRKVQLISEIPTAISCAQLNNSEISSRLRFSPESVLTGPDGSWPGSVTSLPSTFGCGNLYSTWAGPVRVTATVQAWHVDSVQSNFDFSINMNTTYGQLPNPYTPMAFLPPDVAKLILYDIYATMGSLAVGLSSLLPSH